MRLRALAKQILPPVLASALRPWLELARNRGRWEWEYLPDASVRETGVGWNAAGVVATEVEKWDAFRAAVAGTGPLGIAHEAPLPFRQDAGAHDTVMAFGYVLARAARARDRVSLLDWGGGLGHHYLFARALLPEVEVEYHCKEVPLLCSAGRELLPNVVFHEQEETALARRYHLVMASAALQYAPDWEALLGRLGASTSEFLYVTRLPIAHRAPTFQVLQRAWRYGYATEYAGWVVNRQELLAHAEAVGLTLLREFLVQERPLVRGAPEPVEYRGFLFRAPDEPR
jgi:putative methyltransferase (TIGR04325 family)